MKFLDEAIEAGGGLARWNSLKRFSLQLSIVGDIMSHANRSEQFKNIVAEGCMHGPLVRLIGFAGPGECGVYRPDRVTIEDADGKVMRACQNPNRAFWRYATSTRFNELALVFLCGCSVWNYLAAPFILAHADVEVEELSPWPEQGHLWRRLRAVFPARFVIHCHERTFYFDAAGLLRRTDHDLFGIKVADYTWAHQEFDGLVVPTLRRSLRLDTNGKPIAKPSLIEVEIFDAAFA